MNKDAVKEKYYTYMDEYTEYSLESKLLYLQYLISLNNNFYEPYVFLMDLYFENRNNEKAFEIIKLGYDRLIQDEFNNKFPKELEYYEIDNRDKYRLMYNYADALWFFENKHEAIKIFKKILKINPSDNLGVRYAVCGILEDYQCSNHLWNEQNQNIDKWFKEKMKKHLGTRGYGYFKTYLKDNS